MIREYIRFPVIFIREIEGLEGTEGPSGSVLYTDLSSAIHLNLSGISARLRSLCILGRADLLKIRQGEITVAKNKHKLILYSFRSDILGTFLLWNDGHAIGCAFQYGFPILFPALEQRRPGHLPDVAQIDGILICLHEKSVSEKPAQHACSDPKNSLSLFLLQDLIDRVSVPFFSIQGQRIVK